MGSEEHLFPVNGRATKKGILPAQEIEQFISGGVIRANPERTYDYDELAKTGIRSPE